MVKATKEKSVTAKNRQSKHAKEEGIRKQDQQMKHVTKLRDAVIRLVRENGKWDRSGTTARIPMMGVRNHLGLWTTRLRSKKTGLAFRASRAVDIL
jgi:hypothetical protein